MIITHFCCDAQEAAKKMTPCVSHILLSPLVQLYNTFCIQYCTLALKKIKTLAPGWTEVWRVKGFWPIRGEQYNHYEQHWSIKGLEISMDRQNGCSSCRNPESDSQICPNISYRAINYYYSTQNMLAEISFSPKCFKGCQMMLRVVGCHQMTFIESNEICWQKNTVEDNQQVGRKAKKYCWENKKI